MTAAARLPDVLVNLTNDGWFWGSSELDMHLVCGVFRAIECRKPLLIAANTGFSAWIDGDGRILRQGPRRREKVLFAAVGREPRQSWYLVHGDWPAGVCWAKWAASTKAQAGSSCRTCRCFPLSFCRWTAAGCSHGYNWRSPQDWQNAWHRPSPA